MSQFFEMFEGDEYPLIKLGDYTDLTWGDTNTTKNSYVTEGYLAYSASGPDGKLDHYDYDCEGIVLSAIGADCGKTWFASGKWSCIKNTIRFWSTFDDLDNRFLYFATREKDFWPRRGGAQPFIPQGDARNCSIPLPPICLQRKFVEIAEQADKSEFVGCKSQFIEMFGNPVTNTKGWKTAKIKDVAPEMPSKEQLSGKIWLLNLDMIESNTGRIIEKVYEDVENALSVQSFDEGNVLFSKLRPYLNKVVIPDEPGMATTELVPLRPEPSKLHKVFLSHLLRGNQFVNYANDIAGGTKMPRMPLTELRNFDCILPPMDKQLEFVFIAEQVDKSKFGDFKSQFIEMFGNPLSLNQKNELKRLGECCILNPRRPNIALCDTDKVSFIPMPAVSEDGYLVDMTDEEYGKVKKGFTYFENNDVLFAKITPCMENGKGAIVHGLTNGIGMGSTEFHVLRPINGISSPYWLLALTRMPIFRERAAKNMSGTGGQKRVSASYLDHFMVGLPAMEEQRRLDRKSTRLNSSHT